MPFGCADLGALRTEPSVRSAASEKTLGDFVPRARGRGQRARQRSSDDGPERNLGVFPQETEPEAGGGGAGEPQHPEA